MKVAKLTFALLLVSLMAGTVMAQPRGGRGQGGFGGPGGGFDRLAEAVAKLDLTADQKDKLAALKTEYAPKFKALRDKAEGILTADQKKAREDAMKAAREAAPEDRRAAFQKVRDAVKLTDDQKKDQEAVMKDTRSLMEEVRPKIDNILTDDQKAKLKEAMGRRGGRRGGQGGDAAPAKQST